MSRYRWLCRVPLLAWVMVFHGLVFWGLVGVNLPLGHDTMINVQTFRTVYAQVLAGQGFPLWLPASAFGVSADFLYLFTYTPAFYLVTFVGWLIQCQDPLLLFRAGVYVEEIIFLGGLYGLSCQCHRHRLTPVVVALTGILSISWSVQIHWNFHLIYAVPLLLFVTLRFLRGGGLEWFAYLLLAVFLGGLFYTQIFVCSCLVVFTLAWLALHRPAPAAWFRFGVPTWVGFGVLGVALVVVLINVQCAMHGLDGMRSYTPLRQPDGTVALGDFLTYGGYLRAEKYLEWLYGAPVSFDFFAYGGLFSLVCYVLALVSVRDRLLWVFSLTLVYCVLFSLAGDTPVAEWTYRLMPAMNRFRHVGYVTPIAKVLWIVGSGYGVDRLLSIKAARGIAYWGLAALVLLGLFLYLDGSHGWGYPYTVSPDVTMPFWFHYQQWGCLLFIWLVLWLLHRTGRLPEYGLGLALVVLVVLEMGSYKALIEWHAPVNGVGLVAKWRELTVYHNLPGALSREEEGAGGYWPKRLDAADPAVQAAIRGFGYWGSTNSLGYGAFPLDPCFPLHRTDLSSRAVDGLLRARYGISPDAPAQEFYRPTLVDQDTVMLRALGCHEDKAYLVSTPRFVATEDEARATIRTAENLRDHPVILTQNAGHDGPPIPMSPGGGGKATVTLVAFAANRVVFSTSSPLDGYLIYLDAFHPGWHALQDETPVPVLTANLGFKAIPISAGEHRISLSFAGGSQWSKLAVWTNYFVTIALTLCLGMGGLFRLRRGRWPERTGSCHPTGVEEG